MCIPSSFFSTSGSAQAPSSSTWRSPEGSAVILSGGLLSSTMLHFPSSKTHTTRLLRFPSSETCTTRLMGWFVRKFKPTIRCLGAFGSPSSRAWKGISGGRRARRSVAFSHAAAASFCHCLRRRMRSSESGGVDSWGGKRTIFFL